LTVVPSECIFASAPWAMTFMLPVIGRLLLKFCPRYLYISGLFLRSHALFPPFKDP
jgi:hypothetical protein